LTKTRSAANPRSTRSSTPSVRASRDAAGSSRSREVEGEVVAGAGGDHHEGQVVPRRHFRHQGLGAVAARHAQQVGSLGNGLPGEFGHVLMPGAEQDDTGARCAGLVREVVAVHLAAAGARVHEDPGVARCLGGCPLPLRCGGDVRRCRGDPGHRNGQRPQGEGEEGRPQHVGYGVQGQDRDGCDHGQGHPRHARHASVCQGPPHPDGGEGQAGDADQYPQHAAQTGGDEWHQHARQQDQQCQARPAGMALLGGCRGISCRPARSRSASSHGPPPRVPCRARLTARALPLSHVLR
jgi:hypothetical protein